MRNLPLRLKVRLVILFITAIVLFLTVGALFVFNFITFRRDYVRDLATLTEIIANNTTGAAAFHDGKTAGEILNSLRARTDILGAVVNIEDEPVFSSFGVLGTNDLAGSLPLVDGPRFAGEHLIYRQPLVLDGARLGTLSVVADYGAVYGRLRRLYSGILAGVVASSLLLAFVLTQSLQSVLANPIMNLAGAANRIAYDQDYSIRVRKLGDDEVGQLTDAFNLMIERIQTQSNALSQASIAAEEKVVELRHQISEREKAEREVAELHRRMLEVTRQAGMAEVAASVLHNVGNVLNSVNVSATLVSDQLSRSRVVNLVKATSLLAEHKDRLPDFLTKDPKGQRLPDYLLNLAGHLQAENAELFREVELFRGNVEHIKQIVAQQQSHAKVVGVMEELNAPELVEDALRLIGELSDKCTICLRREFAQAPPIFADKHKVLQILVNLIRNAVQSLEEHTGPEKTLTVAIKPASNGLVSISVRDSGLGIAPDNLTKIFGFGFTTKREGHGFGLHSGANDARAMGGSLSAHSEGLGRGAAFVLELPASLKHERYD